MMFKDQHIPNHMSMKRIVSFLPSATELLYEFGAQDNLYGVTHECKYPPDAAVSYTHLTQPTKRIV